MKDDMQAAVRRGDQVEEKVSSPDDALHPDNYAIALYYLYVPCPAERSIATGTHKQFQQSICDRLNLSGRIRVAPEGINGVLSGRVADLKAYESDLSQCLEEQLASQKLDIKYCQLRRDLPVESQLFSSLSVRETDQVVSLVGLCGLTSDASNSSPKADGKVRRRRKKADNNDDNSVAIASLFQKSLQNFGFEQPPQRQAPHLSPCEWNEALKSLTSDQSNDVVLLDCRNVYESNVGSFVVPNSSTLLTNTRQYSDLPSVLVDQVDRLAKSSHIFSFCTGGVRCERATQFLNQLLEETDSKNHNNKKPQVYQLHGGIQRYLEAAASTSSITSDTIENFFHGKNFVFDPRRTDPLHGPIITGRCRVCCKPHDDYDNGSAPASRKESRCFYCRILVLVCNDCRSTVTCWGDGDTDSPYLSCAGVGNQCHKQVPVLEIQN